MAEEGESSGPRTPEEAAAAAEENNPSGTDSPAEGSQGEDGADVIAPQELTAVRLFGRLAPPVYLESYEGSEEESELYSEGDESEEHSDEEAYSGDHTGDGEDSEAFSEAPASGNGETADSAGDDTITFENTDGDVIAPVVITGEETTDDGTGAPENDMSGYAENTARSTSEDMLKSESGAVLVYIPLVEGLTFSRIEVGQTVPGQNSRVFDMLDTFRTYVINTGNVPDRIVIGDNMDLSVLYGGAEVRLGTGDYLDERLNELKYIHPHLAGLTGTLHLENFDGSQDEVIFSKK